MITLVANAPENVAAFRASGSISEEDFKTVVLPNVQAKVNTFGELNYLFYIDTELENFSAGAWFEDALLGLKEMMNWNRVAIVTDEKSVQNFTDIFSVVLPGEFKSFPVEDLENALFWCENGNEVGD